MDCVGSKVSGCWNFVFVSSRSAVTVGRRSEFIFRKINQGYFSVELFDTVFSV